MPGGGKIDDREAGMAEPNPPVSPSTLMVRAAVPQYMVHGPEPRKEFSLPNIALFQDESVNATHRMTVLSRFAQDCYEERTKWGAPAAKDGQAKTSAEIPAINPIHP